MRYKPNIIYRGKEIKSKEDFPLSIDYFRKIEKIKNYIYPTRFLSKINSQFCDFVTTEFEFLEKFGRINTQLGIKGDTFIEQFLKANDDIKYLDFYIRPHSTPANWRDSYTTPNVVYHEYKYITAKLGEYTQYTYYNGLAHYSNSPYYSPQDSVYLGNIKNYYLDFLIFKIFKFRDIPKGFEEHIVMLCHFFMIFDSFSFIYYDLDKCFFSNFISSFYRDGLLESLNIFLDTIKDLIGFLGGDINHEYLKYPNTYHSYIVYNSLLFKDLKMYLLELL